VVCAVSSKPVGIDIEKIREVDLDIAKRFFQKKRLQIFLQKKIMRKQNIFLNCGH